MYRKCQRVNSGQSEVRLPSATWDWRRAEADSQAVPHLVQMGCWMQPGIMRVDVSWNQLVLGSNYSLPLELYELGKLYGTY